jgi:acyl carrier protein
MTPAFSDPVTNTVVSALLMIKSRGGGVAPDIGPESLEQPFDIFDLDSMDKLEFVMALEDSLGKVFDANRIVQCKTLADIIELARR